MSGLERNIASPVETMRTELNSLFDYGRRSVVQQALAKRFGERWNTYSMQERNDAVYIALGEIRKKAEDMFGTQQLHSADAAERNMMLDAVILNEFGMSAGSQGPLSSSEQNPSAPVPKAEWLKRYAGMFGPGEGDAAYDSYVRKVREGKIKP